MLFMHVMQNPHFSRFTRDPSVPRYRICHRALPEPLDH